MFELPFVAPLQQGPIRAVEAILRFDEDYRDLTQALRELEEHIGVTLLDRTKRPARLTDEGQQLAAATHDGLAMISSAIESIQARSMAREKQVTVACTLGMATYWLMPRLPDFYARCPEITVNVQAPPSDLPELLPGIDVVLRYGKGKWDGGDSASKLFEERVCPVGKPQLVQRLLDEGVDLKTAPLIDVHSHDNLHWAGWRHYLEKRAIARPNMRGAKFNNYVQATQAALDGQGLMLGWRSITARLVADGSLIKWPDGELNLGTGYYILVTEEPSSAGILFVEWLNSLRETELDETRRNLS